MSSLSEIKTKLQKVFTKQLSLVNLAVMSIIMNYLRKSNGKEQHSLYQTTFCIPVHSVRPSHHNACIFYARNSQSHLHTFHQEINNTDD